MDRSSPDGLVGDGEPGRTKLRVFPSECRRFRKARGGGGDVEGDGEESRRVGEEGR